MVYRRQCLCVRLDVDSPALCCCPSLGLSGLVLHATAAGHHEWLVSQHHPLPRSLKSERVREKGNFRQGQERYIYPSPSCDAQIKHLAQSQVYDPVPDEPPSLESKGLRKTVTSGADTFSGAGSKGGQVF